MTDDGRSADQIGQIEQIGRIGRDWRDSEPWWPPEPAPPPGAPNVVLVVLDDVGFAQLGCYGSDIATPAIDGLAAGGVRLANFRTTALCSPTAGVPADRPEPPSQRDGPGGRPGHRLPWLLGTAAEGERLPVGDPARPRLRDLGRREVAPHARGRDPHGRAPGDVAARPGLRPLVRVPRRRDPPVRPGALPRQPFGAAAPVGGGRVPPDRRPGRPGDRIRRRPPGGRRGPAVLPLPGDRGLPLAASGAGRVDRPVPGSVRRGVGRLAGGDARPAAGPRRRAAGYAAVAPAAVGAGVGGPRRPGPGGGRPVHGVLRRLPLPHRRPDRPGARLPRHPGRARRHRRDRRLGQRRQRRGGSRRGRSTTSG